MIRLMWPMTNPIRLIQPTANSEDCGKVFVVSRSLTVAHCNCTVALRLTVSSLWTKKDANHFVGSVAYLALSE